MRFIYLILGFSSLLIALLGIILPLLPTTPFLLLSAFFLARSSDKFHTWLIKHAYFGKIINDWQQNRSISRANKAQAIIVIMITFGISVALNVPTMILIIQAIILSLVSCFILTRPSK